MELQNLDHQLKMAIQNHQLLVSKMKNDPQNGALQKQLHELQSQIKILSEKQKQVVQQLRNDLEIKQHQPPKCSANLLKPAVPQGTIAQLPASSLIFPTGKVVVRPPSPITTTTTTTMATAAAVLLATTATTNGNIHLHHHHHRSASSGAAAILMRTSGSTAVAPSPVAADNHQSPHPPPPIRVPQYPVIHLVGSSGGSGAVGGNGGFVIAPSTAPPNKESTTTTHVLPRITPPATNTVVTLLPSNASVDRPSTPPLPSPSRPSSLARRPSEVHRPRSSDIDSAKAKFMTALGLVTHDILDELQNRKSERKRRTTANPQFSYHSWEHADKRNNMSYLSGCLPAGFKRPRGRPRVCSSGTPTGSRPSTPEDVVQRQQHDGPSNGASPIKSTRNGIREEADFCQICKERDHLLNLVCEVCSHRCHSTCLAATDDDATTNSPYVCSGCLAAKKKYHHHNHGWPRSLAAVHTYLAHKAAKEDEKLRLARRNVELKAERSKLEDKAKQLTEALSQYVHKRNAVMSNTKDTLESIDRIKNFIRMFQQQQQQQSS